VHGYSWKKPLWIGLMLAATGAFAPRARAQSVGGHVGIAFPLATFSDNTTTIADSTVIAAPIGIGVGLTEALKLDFETVVLTQVRPGGTTTMLVDPGLVYNWGPVATGLRIAFQIGAKANIGCIPLVNVPLVKVGKATWFAEAAFPIFYRDHKGSLTTVLHTGFGF
jgi:hypothetical protein